LIWPGYVARTGRGVYRIIVAKPNRKRPLRRTRRGWMYNKKIFLKKWGGDMGWIDLAQDRNKWRPGMYVGMKIRAY